MVEDRTTWQALSRPGFKKRSFGAQKDGFHWRSLAERRKARNACESRSTKRIGAAAAIVICPAESRLSAPHFRHWIDLTIVSEMAQPFTFTVKEREGHEAEIGDTAHQYPPAVLKRAFQKCLLRKQ
jgi:hypothetical protein